MPLHGGEPALAVADALRRRQEAGYFEWDEGAGQEALREFVLQRNAEAEAAAPSHDSDTPVCFETAGLLGGLVSEAFGAVYYAVEVECAAQGSGICRFRLMHGGDLPMEYRWMTEEAAAESPPTGKTAHAHHDGPSTPPAPDPLHIADFVAASAAFRRLVHRIAQWREPPRLAAFSGTESTGRRTLAQLAARRLLQPGAPFVVLDGRDAPAEVMHARLFGAIDKPNRATALREAAGGALFIRRPERFPMAAQAALARLATDPPAGGKTASPAAIFLAPRDPLHQLVESGRLFPDLAGAAGVNAFFLPALAERPEDVPPLINYFLRHFEAKYRTDGLSFDRTALDLLSQQTWPGNAVQLMNTVEYAVLFGEGPRLGLAALPSELTADAVAKRSGSLTADMIRTALQQAQGKRMEAAAALGIDRTTLWRAMKRLGIEGH